MPTPTPMRHVLVGLLAALALSACAGDTGGSGELDDQPSASATVAPTGSEVPGNSGADPSETTAAPDPVTVSGVLGGSNLEGGCVWLDAEDGTRYELIGGPSASVAIDPANQVIADTTGTVIAEAGDAVEVTGTVDDGLATFCQVGENLVVDSISAG